MTEGQTTQQPRTVDYARLLLLGKDLLQALGYNPEEERFLETPRRWADSWKEFIEYDPGKMTTSFSTEATDQVVVVSGMRVWSMCEHHMLPFWTKIDIGYRPSGKVLGLSKFARIANACAHELQIQERLVIDIANKVEAFTGSKDVAVLATGEHLCMSMRGIRTDALMTSSVMRGIFREEASARAELLRIAERR